MRWSLAFVPMRMCRLTVAVFPFQTLGKNAALQPFNRGLVAMITADLARVPALTVLERERIDALLRELRLADLPSDPLPA